MFDVSGIFHDMTEQFLSPAQADPGEPVEITLRTGDSEDFHVELVRRVIEEDGSDLYVRKPMRRGAVIGNGFRFFRTRIRLDHRPLEYFFEVRSPAGKILYDRLGPTGDGTPRVLFRLIPGFHTPAWAEGAVMYQIFPDRFCNGDPSNDVLDGEYSYLGGRSAHVGDWDRPPAPEGADFREFYGGDLQGIIDKLDYLEELGIQAIYLNPVFCSPSSHKYDTQDYAHIDPHLGRIVTDRGELLPPGDMDNRHATRYISRVGSGENLEASDALFALLVKKAHEHGIRVILDGVFNHCGSFNRWMDRERIYEQTPGYPGGAYATAESPYRDYFSFTEEAWPCNPHYEGWWNYDTLPKLNYEGSERLAEEILAVARKWVSPPYNADGWRLDVAADLGHSPEYNHRFWQRFRQAVKEANPDAVIIAEHYGDAGSWLSGGEWDSVMNYDAFMEPVSWFFTGMDKHSDRYDPEAVGNEERFWAEIRGAGARSFSRGSLFMAMNQLSNHDHSRFLTRTNGRAGRSSTLGTAAAGEGIDPAVFREAVLVQMTWPGAPTLYYGDEAGVCGFTDPDNRRTYPWGHEDQALLAFHRDVIRIHRENPELIHGSLMPLPSKRGVLAYGRFTAESACLILLNRNPYSVTDEYDVRPLGIPEDAVMRQLIMSTPAGYHTAAEERYVKVGFLTVTLSMNTGMIFKNARGMVRDEEKFLAHGRFLSFT